MVSPRDDVNINVTWVNVRMAWNTRSISMLVVTLPGSLRNVNQHMAIRQKTKWLCKR